jgi:hypothetical protein
MNIKKGLISFITGFAITLVVSIAVTYLYSLAFHDAARIDWETSFRLAVTFGILIPIIEARNKKPKVKAEERK